MPIATTYDPAAPSATSGQGPAVANREDLSDILTILAPEETPILSLAGKSKAKSTFAEWTVDKLATPNADGVNEGEDVSTFDNKSADKARIGNYVQKFRRPWLVSDLQEAVDTAGPAEVAQAETKCMREVKRDIEYAFASDNEMQAEDGANPYKLRGLGKWIQSTAQSTNPVPSDYRTPAASINASGETFSESALNGLLSSIFSKTGDMSSLTLIAARTLRSTISEFTRTEGTSTDRTYSVNEQATSKRITLSVDTFDSDFGMLAIINGNPDCMPDVNRGYILNPKYYGCKELIPVHSVRLENQGGGERGFVSGTLTLTMRHPQAHGEIEALS